MIRIVVLILICFLALHTKAQDALEEGYAMLENQEFEKASVFFSNVLTKDSSHKTARICYARARGLSGFAPEALEMFEALLLSFPRDIEVRLNIAEAQLWNKQYDAAIETYSSILVDKPNNFVANYGYANAHAALFENDIALEYMNKAIALDPNNAGARNSKNHIILSKAYLLYKDGQYTNAKQWLDTLARLDPQNVKIQEINSLISAERKTSIEARYLNARDLGGNLSESKGIHFKFNMTDRHALDFDLSTVNLSNENIEGIATQNTFFVSDKIHINDIFRLTLGGGLSSANVDESIITVLNYKSSLEAFWNAKLYTSLGYSNQVQNYSKELLQENIVSQDISFAFNFNITDWLGIYNNTIYTTQSDFNKRGLAFTSMYFSLFKKPLVRIGANHNYMIFKNNVSAYFSPDVYQSYEGFLLLDSGESSNKMKYKILGAIGQQFIGEGEAQMTSRAECSFGYVFGFGVKLMGKYQFNNTAQATASGAYSFHQWSVTLGYDIM